MEGDNHPAEWELGDEISIHTLRVEGDFAVVHHILLPDISIHTRRVEGDPDGQPLCRVQLDFNPHPPRGG